MYGKGLVDYHKSAEIISILGREMGTCAVTGISGARLRVGLNK